MTWIIYIKLLTKLFNCRILFETTKKKKNNVMGE